MHRIAAAFAAAMFIPITAHAHGVAGPRIFPATLTVDDPAVADEWALPTVTWQRMGVDNNGNGPTNQYTISTSFAKTITDRFGVFVTLGHVFNAVAGGNRLVLAGQPALRHADATDLCTGRRLFGRHLAIRG